MTRPKKQSGKITDLGYARIDLERQDRCGAAEVIFGEGKSPAQVAQIAEALDKAGQRVLVTRTNADAYRAVKKKFPKAKWYPEGRIITTEPLPRPRAADAPAGHLRGWNGRPAGCRRGRTLCALLGLPGRDVL
jgi:NCAIR mutase (PurE)-related protein